MTWGYISDDLFVHPKFQDADPAASHLWLTALSWSNKFLTDGYIPFEQVPRLMPQVDKAMAWSYAAVLVCVGLWDEADGPAKEPQRYLNGYVIHDFLDYNDSREEVFNRRADGAERVRKHRSRGQARSNVLQPTKSNVLQTPLHSLDVTPVLNLNLNHNLKEKDKDIATAAASPLEHFDRFWALYPKKVSKPSAQRAWKKLKPNTELVEKILAALEAQKKHFHDAWTKEGGAFCPHPATWLNNHRWEEELPAHTPGRPTSFRNNINAEWKGQQRGVVTLG